MILFLRRYSVVGGLIRHLFQENAFLTGELKAQNSLVSLLESPSLVAKYFAKAFENVEAFISYQHSIIHLKEVKLVGSRLVCKSVSGASSFVTTSILKRVQATPSLNQNISIFLSCHPAHFENAFFHYLEDLQRPDRFFDARLYYHENNLTTDCSLLANRLFKSFSSLFAHHFSPARCLFRAVQYCFMMITSLVV